MKMRLTWYAGVSTALAGGVVLLAFHQRANFYSAMVHLAQSNLSLMILVNLVLIMYASLMYGLQRLLYGPLRPVEIEQLYEKAWIAVTETCLAMTIFRDEVGAFFLVMFTALVTGKVWGWIGEGRVEILEQQPPADPWLFHTRLSLSLLLSIVYDAWLLYYTANTVWQQARPTMMVMFLFEFAILMVCSLQTALRYAVSLVEQRVIKIQTRQRLEERRSQIREQRAEILRRRQDSEGAAAHEQQQQPLPSEDDVDEMDIEVPGWQSKGQWVLAMDLVADFVKLAIYTAFFCVLFTFYGLPIHIIRDLVMTTRSLYKKVEALIRYRKAIQEMDQYADATAEELGREDTCIICREEMHVWEANDPQRMERSRPKKLPCGHILHFGCLKSWLERQQVCPTCRRQVVRDPGRLNRNGDAMLFRINFQLGQNPLRQQGEPPAENGAVQGDADGRPPPLAANGQPNNAGRVRMFNFGPFRLGFAQGGAREIQDMANRLGLAPDAAAHAPPRIPIAQQQQQQQQPAMENVGVSIDGVRAQIAALQQRVTRDAQLLQNSAQELHVLNLLLRELARLRSIQQLQHMQEFQQMQPSSQLPPPPASQNTSPGPAATGPAAPLPNGPRQTGPGPGPAFLPPHPPNPPFLVGQAPPPSFGVAMPPAMPSFGPFVPRPPSTRPGASGHGTAIPSGSPDLPEGVVIPPGWSLLPLQRVEGGGIGGGAPAPLPADPPPPPPPPHLDPVISPFQDMVQRAAAQAQNARVSSSSSLTQQTTSSTAIPGSDRGVTGTHESGSATASSQPQPPSLSADAPLVPSTTDIAPDRGGSSHVGGHSHASSSFSPQAPHLPAPSMPRDADAAGSSHVANGHGRDPADKGKAVSMEEAEDDGV